MTDQSGERGLNGVPRLRTGETLCPACAQPGRVLDSDERGFRIGHPGRAFPCRAAWNSPRTGWLALNEELRQLFG